MPGDRFRSSEGRTVAPSSAIGARLALLLALLVCGCDAVPPAATSRMNALAENGLATLDPDAMRLRLVLPQGYVFDPDQTQLALTVSSGGRSRSADLHVEEVGAQSGVHRQALFEPGMPVVTWTLRLTAPSRKSFRELQQILGTDNDFLMNVQLSMKSAPPEASSVKVWADLMLTEKEGYFRVVDGGNVDFSRRDVYQWRPQ